MKHTLLILFIIVNIYNSNAQQCLSGDCRNGYGEWENLEGTIIKSNRTNGKSKGFYRMANKSEPKKNTVIGYFDGENGYGKNFKNLGNNTRVLKLNIKLEEAKNDIITVQNDLCKLQIAKGNLSYVFLITKDKSFYVFELKDNKQVFEMKILNNAVMLSHFDSMQQPDNGLYLDEINNKLFIYPFKIKTTGISATNSNDRDAITNIMNRKFDETYNRVNDIYKSIITLFDTVSSEQSFVRIANNILGTRKVIEQSFFPIIEQVKKEYEKLYKNGKIVKQKQATLPKKQIIEEDNNIYSKKDKDITPPMFNVDEYDKLVKPSFNKKLYTLTNYLYAKASLTQNESRAYDEGLYMEFIVEKDGKITSISSLPEFNWKDNSLSNSSEHRENYSSMRNAFYEMPKWITAKDKNGNAVKYKVQLKMFFNSSRSDFDKLWIESED